MDVALMLPKFMPKILQTPAGEILLREAQRKDLLALNKIINEPEVNKFVLVPAPVSMKETGEYYVDIRSSGRPWVACILGQEVVGSIDIRPKFGRESHVCEFGIAFSKKAHGRGIAQATAGYCFGWMKKNNIEKVVSEVIGDNVRARAFYKKIGFKELCPLKRNFKRGKRYVDTVIIEKFL